ncbi:glycine zipper domain-containing protein [Thiocystis violascens]|uniref:glycine zipper domain-containing protein n=1 Tax=Thiocystis violascens TaxID=73141 RepID=UPI001575E8F3|nr:hypothetical protein [Thiocystis violascens]
MLKIAPGAVLGALVLGALAGGCVTPGDQLGNSVAGATSWIQGVGGGAVPAAAAEADLTPAERRLREQSRAFQKTVWEGVLIGAGAGTLWGVIQGDKGSDLLKKALVGGAVGGLAGAYIGHKQNQYSDKEDQLDSMIADVRQSNTETKELIASVRTVIAEDKRRLADVQKRYKKGQATDAEVAGVRQRIAANGSVVAQASKGAREKQGMFQGAEKTYRQQNPATDTARLQGEIQTFNRQIETLDGLASSISVA